MKVLLKELGEIITGNTPSKKTEEFWNSEDICFVKPDIIAGNGVNEIMDSNEYISEEARKKARVVGKNSIFITCIGSIGKIGIASDGEYAFNQQINAIIPNDRVQAKYLAYNLLFNKPRLVAIANAPVVPIINKGQFGEFTVNVETDIDRQSEIVDVLDKLTQIIQQRNKEISALDNLIKARFAELFGDTFSNPKRWPTKTFREASLRLSDGPFGSNLKSEHYSENGVRVIRLGNIGVGKFIDKDQSYVSLDHYARLKKYTCKPGEIVIGTLGEPNLRACIIPDYVKLAVNKADCVHYVPDSKILENTFVCQYINCPTTLLLASNMVHGQTRARVSSGQIAKMPIFIPPLSLQQQFADFVAQIDKSKHHSPPLPISPL